MRQCPLGVELRGIRSKLNKLAVGVLQWGVGNCEAERVDQRMEVAAATVGGRADDFVAQWLPPAEPGLRVLASNQRSVHPDRDDSPDASPTGTLTSDKLSKIATYRARS